MSKRIVLLGCGYTSVWCYKFLRKNAGSLIRKGAVEIVLLSDTDYHAFHGFTGEFLSGFLSLDFHKTFYQEVMENARFIRGRVVQINQQSQEIIYEVADGAGFDSLAYDELVVGIGSTDKEDTVKGMGTYSLGVKKIGALEECREKVLHSLQMATQAESREERKKYLTFAVVGGGFAAAEICGNLQEYLEKLSPHFPAKVIRVFSLPHPLWRRIYATGKKVLWFNASLQQKGN